MTDQNRPLWARLDCSWRDNPKIHALIGERGGWQAIVMYLHGITYATHHLTDGELPLTWPKLNGYDKGAVKLLLSHELWFEVADYKFDEEGLVENPPPRFYLINDFDAYQISRALWSEIGRKRKEASLKAHAARYGHNVVSIQKDQ